MFKGLRSISSVKNKAYSRITVYTAVQISHCIILRFVPLSSYWQHEICLKYKLFTLRGQCEGGKPLEERRGGWEDNIKIDVK